MIKFGVLGPLEVDSEARAIPIPAGKQRIALATLLLNPNRFVSPDHLIERMWEGGVPHDTRSSLHTHIARLRQALGEQGEDLIETHNGGYVAHAGPESLDLLRFRQLVARAGEAADPHAEGTLLREALGLWRGPVLLDVPSDALHRNDIRSLLEERLRVRERCFELALRAGEGSQVIGELRAAVAEHPLSERFSAQLMLCLYQAGRQAEALEVYDAVRRSLHDELGLEPGQELRRAQAQVLRQQPIAGTPRPPAPAMPVPAELPAAVTTFTGRAEQARGLCAALERDQAGIAAIAGAGGIGKSALAIHVAHRVAARFPDGRLYVNLHGATPEVAPLGAHEVLARFLRSLGVAAGEIPDEVEAAASLFRSLTGGKRLLIVLDNAHDAAQIRPMLPGGGGCGVLVTSRRMLTSIDGAHHVPLDALPSREAHDLLARLVTGERLDAEPEAAAEVLRHCGGLPLALCIAAARLISRPAWPVATLAERLSAERRRINELEVGDRAIRASFMLSYQDLLTAPGGAAAGFLFRSLGLFDGTDISPPIAAALTGSAVEEAEPLLETLADAQLIQAQAPGRYRMHDLLRLFARELSTMDDTDAAAAVRRLMHCYLATGRTAISLLNPSAAWRAGVGPADLAHTGVALHTTADALAWIDAEAANLVAVVRQAVAAGDDDITLSLAATLSYALYHRGRWGHELLICQAVLGVAKRSGDPRYLGIIHDNLGTALSSTDRVADAVPHLKAALQAYRRAGEGKREATTLDHLAVAMRRLGHFDQSIDYHLEALRLHRAHGNRFGEGIALTNVGLVYQRVERFEEAFQAHLQAFAIFKDSGNTRAQAAVLGNLAEGYRLAGRLQMAIDCFEQTLELDRSANHSGSYGHAERLWGLGRCHHDLGQLDKAKACWDAAATILHRLGLISHEERESILASATPKTPQIIERQL